MKEHRENRRVKIDLEIEYGCAGERTVARSIDMSPGGVFIASRWPLPADAELWLRFSLPGDSEQLYVLGRVIWVKHDSKASPSGMGIEFIRMSHAHLRKIKAFIEMQLSEAEQEAGDDLVPASFQAARSGG